MSKKHRPVKNPEKLLTSRGDVINFLNYISTDENFCLRVWNTVQSVFERTKLQAEEAAQKAAESAALPCATEIIEHEHEVALLP